MRNLIQEDNEHIRVLIADADPLTARLIADGLTRGQHAIEVVALSSTSSETIRELETSRPDVALINAHLEDGPLSGYQVLQYLQLLSHKTAAIMLIPDSKRELVVDAFRWGAKGVFCRLQSTKLLSKCVRTVHGGQIWATNQTLSLLLDFLTQLKPLRVIKPGAGRNRLTHREAEVVQLLTEGLSTREVSQKLCLTEHTVRNYLSSVYEKLGVSSRVELALYAVAREDLNPPPLE